MTREEYEASSKLSIPTKLIIEWLARHDDRIYNAKEIGAALGVPGSLVTEHVASARATGAFCKKDKAHDLQLAEVLLAPEVRAAYRADKQTKQTKQADGVSAT